MKSSARHNQSLTWPKLGTAPFEINDEPALHYVEKLVFRRVLMPVIFALDHSHSNDRIVHAAQRLVPPLIRTGVCKFFLPHDFERAVLDVQIRVIAVLCCIGHAVSLSKMGGSAGPDAARWRNRNTLVHST